MGKGAKAESLRSILDSCFHSAINEQKAGIEATGRESANIGVACKETVILSRPLTDEEKRILKDLQR